MARSKTAKLLLPLFLGFYVMGFVDFAGIATSYVKAEFSGALPDEFFGFLPSAVLVWFLVFSIPSAVLMGKIGRRNTALLSAAITALSAALAFCFDSIWFCVAGFALLGIGNVILQVSMMPLLSACVVPERLASAASAGAIHKGAFVVCRPVYRALCGGNSRLMEMDFSDFRGDNNTFWNLALFYRYTGTARARVGLHRKGCGAAFQQDNSRIVFCDCRRCGA